MKSLCFFLFGGVMGAVVVALADQPCFLASQRAPERTAATTIRSYEDKYIACMIDQLHCALMLQATCSDLVPDWLDLQIANYADELNSSLAENDLSPDAISMIHAFYSRNDLPIPDAINTLFEERQQDHCRSTITDRLAVFDKYMARRKNGRPTNRPPILRTSFSNRL